jgi:hypothetical protein
MPFASHRRAERGGAVLLAVTCLLTLVLAIGGVVLDTARLLSARNVLQAQLEGAALAAVLELDGTREGLARARTEAAAGGGKLGFAATAVRCEFAASEQGPWENEPLSADRMRFVRVTGEAPVHLTLVKALVRGDASNVWAAASAGQRPQTTFSVGLFPYSPIAPGGEAPHYGLRRGQHHTLRWAAEPALERGNVCPGDAVDWMVKYALSERDQPVGWIEMTGRTHVREAVLWGAQTYVRRLGDALRGMGGTRAVESSAIAERIGQDTDANSRTYAEYVRRGLGNGRRIVAAPMHSPPPGSRIVQIGAFFLMPARDYPESGDVPFCAEYLGPYVQGSKRKGAAEAGFHVAVLLR